MECSIREYGDMLDNTMESSDNIVIPIERELFGEEIELGHFSIEKSNLLDICSMDWLSVTCMTTYMMKYLYGNFMSSQERYTFANPSNFTNYGNDDGEKVQHLQHRLGYVRRNQILLIPYNLGVIRAFTYTGGKRMMAGPKWQVVKVSFFDLSFVSLEEDCEKAQESYVRREGRLKKRFATPHMASTPFNFIEPYGRVSVPQDLPEQSMVSDVISNGRWSKACMFQKEVKLVGRSVEKLESTVDVLAGKVDIVKRESERQRKD
ncbi:hypothetical protein IFM89_031122 [Coptis chinensis]|uniref:Uncharacterized protein n=1 Tax=Coptis chinensis TaxID=261450 RepID=A0A835IS00_9MAGN|nr:hypothetical protein IFM89_031122 [Coptis chinensis]